MVCESLPESAIQLAILFRSKEPSSLMLYSIVSSIAVAGFIMADTNISYERESFMAQARRGVENHPLVCLLPTHKAKNIGFQFSLFLFHTAYLATGVLTFVGFLLVGKTRYMFLGLLLEFCVVLTILRIRHQTFHYCIATANHLTFVDVLCWIVMITMMQNFTPFIPGRYPVVFGGRLFFLLILYRLLMNVGVFFACTSIFDETILISQKEAQNLMLGCAILTGVAYLSLIACTRASRRYQLHTSRETGKGHVARFYTHEFLTGNYETHDEMAVAMTVSCHPAYIPFESFAHWILQLKPDIHLFNSKVVPKTSGDCAGWTHEHLFETLEHKLVYFERLKDEQSRQLFQQTKDSIVVLKEKVYTQDAAREKEEQEREQEYEGNLHGGQPLPISLTLDDAMLEIERLKEKINRMKMKKL